MMDTFWNFIEQNRSSLLWAASVLVVTAILLALNEWIMRVIRRRWTGSVEYSTTLRAFQQTIRVFIVLLAIGLIAYVFLEDDKHALLQVNIVRLGWIFLVIMVAILANAFAKGYFISKVAHLPERDRGDVTTYRWLSYIIRGLIIAVALILCLYAVPPLRDLAKTAGLSVSVLAVMVGVASQEAIANLVGGLFIVAFKPFRIGDIIALSGNIEGTVSDINLRHTVIVDYHNRRVIIPNAVINKENVTNYYLGDYKHLATITIGISYESDIDQAMKILQDLCEAHPSCIDNRDKNQREAGAPIVKVQVVQLADSSVNIKAWVWSTSYVTAMPMVNDLLKQVKQSYDQHNIVIPFPQLTVSKIHGAQPPTAVPEAPATGASEGEGDSVTAPSEVNVPGPVQPPAPDTTPNEAESSEPTKEPKAPEA